MADQLLYSCVRGGDCAKRGRGQFAGERGIGLACERLLHDGLWKIVVVMMMNVLLARRSFANQLLCTRRFPMHRLAEQRTRRSLCSRLLAPDQRGPAVSTEAV